MAAGRRGESSLFRFTEEKSSRAGEGGTRTDTRGHTRARTGTHATTGTNEHAANTPPQPTQKNVDQQCTQQGRSGAKDAAHGTKHAQGATAQIHRTLGIHTITENPQKKITGHPKNLFKFACKIFPAAAPPPSSTSRKTTTRRSSLMRHLAKKGDNIGRHGVSLASSPPSLCWELVQCAGETCDRDHRVRPIIYQKDSPQHGYAPFGGVRLACVRGVCGRTGWARSQHTSHAGIQIAACPPSPHPRRPSPPPPSVPLPPHRPTAPPVSAFTVHGESGGDEWRREEGSGRGGRSGKPAALCEVAAARLAARSAVPSAPRSMGDVAACGKVGAVAGGGGWW